MTSTERSRRQRDAVTAGVTIEYRSATAADAEPIARLHTDSWRRTYRGMYKDEFLDGDLLSDRRDVWVARLERPSTNQVVVVATADARLVGFVCGYGDDDEEWGSLVDNLHVDPDFHRWGIASTLMSRAGSWFASSYGESGVYLWVLEANHGARRFYEALGAENAETVDMEIHPGGWGRSCRYVWSSLSALAGHGGDVTDTTFPSGSK